MGRKAKIAAAAAAGLALAATAAAGYGAHRLYRLALDPMGERDWVFSARHNAVRRREGGEDSRRQAEDFVRAHPPASRYRTSHDGLRLHALAYENPQGPRDWVIVVHGYTSDAAHMADAAMALYRAGYSVLVPDCRGHGQSAGHYIAMGWHDRLDVLGWAQSLAAAHPGGDIALYGVSMGGATVMMAAGEALPPQVYAVVEDCGYTSAWDEMAYQLRALFGLPRFPLLHMASLVCRLRAGYSLGEASAVRQLAKATRPMLFIHGLDDTFVPGTMLEQVYAACAAPVKEKLAVPGAGHGMAASRLGPLYWDAVVGFLRRNRPVGIALDKACPRIDNRHIPPEPLKGDTGNENTEK